MRPSSFCVNNEVSDTDVRQTSAFKNSRFRFASGVQARPAPADCLSTHRLKVLRHETISIIIIWILEAKVELCRFKPLSTSSSLASCSHACHSWAWCWSAGAAACPRSHRACQHSRQVHPVQIVIICTYLQSKRWHLNALNLCCGRISIESQRFCADVEQHGRTVVARRNCLHIGQE